jgi:hypothetical protein
MQISSSTNNYQSLQTQQQPVRTLPVQEPEPKYSDKEIYDASQGNLIRNQDEKVILTPQGKTNLNNSQDAKAAESAQAQQAQRDDKRGTATDYLAINSKKSQAEIYISVATDSEGSSSNETVNVINELRDIQKQNNTVQAYATYKENQTKPYLA